jgi:hypothetical protein
MSVPREKLATALQGSLDADQMKQLIDGVLAITKRVRVEMTCKKCGAQQIQFGTTSDAKAVAQALPDLLNQAYGRPGEEAHQAEPIQLHRYSITDLDRPAKPDPKASAAKQKPGNHTGRTRKAVKATKVKPEG